MPRSRPSTRTILALVSASALAVGLFYYASIWTLGSSLKGYALVVSSTIVGLLPELRRPTYLSPIGPAVAPEKAISSDAVSFVSEGIGFRGECNLWLYESCLVFAIDAAILERPSALLRVLKTLENPCRLVSSDEARRDGVGRDLSDLKTQRAMCPEVLRNLDKVVINLLPRLDTMPHSEGQEGSGVLFQIVLIPKGD